MSCLKQYDSPGFKTYSDYVPGYAQGAYFPGDEPGLCCRKTRDICEDPDGEQPAFCDAAETTEWLCPQCADDEEEVLLEESGHGVLFCRRCGKSWNYASELTAEYNAFTANAVAELRKLEVRYADLEKKYRHEVGELKHILEKLAGLLPKEILKAALETR